MSIGSLSLHFAPLLPWPLLVAATLLAAGLLGFGFWRRARGSLWRLLAFVAVLGALANPSAVREDRKYLDNIAVIVVDDSESQNVLPRRAQTAAALAEAEKRIKRIPGLELRVIHDNDGVLAAHLEADALEGGGARQVDVAAYLGGSRE